MDDLRTILQDLQGSGRTSAKLNGKNFPKWSRELRMALTDAGLWEVVTIETAAAARDPAWIKQNNKAMLIIFRACEPAQQDIIDGLPDAFAVWKKLKEVYQARDASSVQRLYVQFTNLRKESQESMIQWIACVKSYARQLDDAEETISQTVLFTRILTGLGSEYDSVKTVLDLVDNLNETKLTSVLMSAESRLMPVSKPRPHSKNRARSRSRTRRSRSRSSRFRDRRASYRDRDRERGNANRGVTCTHCGRTNHTEATCWDAHPELRNRARNAQRDRRYEEAQRDRDRLYDRYVPTAAVAEHASYPASSANATPLPLSQRIEFPNSGGDRSLPNVMIICGIPEITAWS